MAVDLLPRNVLLPMQLNVVMSMLYQLANKELDNDGFSISFSHFLNMIICGEADDLKALIYI